MIMIMYVSIISMLMIIIMIVFEDNIACFDI
jgi:hypothetical protein